ncbi:MAG: hypothetical protein K6A74_10850 [Lachnospiraceae bacterium]|nr:hypothetical protein [Lachnospiraceae bacterium]
MQTTLQKYKLADLYEGMRVFKEQLSDIYDTWIILYRPKKTKMKEDGIIGFIGAETNEKSDALYTDDNVIIPVFNDSNDLEGDIFDEE